MDTDFLEAKLRFDTLRNKLFGADVISAVDWRRLCRCGDTSIIDLLSELSQRKLFMLRSFYNLHAPFFQQFAPNWIFLVECTLDDNLPTFISETDAFEAGCEIGGYPLGVFTISPPGTINSSLNSR